MNQYSRLSCDFGLGGFNRGQGVITPDSPLYGKFETPLFYAPDTLVTVNRPRTLGPRLAYKF